MTAEVLVNELGATALAWGLRFAGAIALLVAGWFVSGWASRQLRAWLDASELLDATLRPLAARITRILLLVLTIVAVLSRFGVETTSIVALIGAAGVAIGLALQGTLSNVAAGIVLVVLRPFRVDDFIEVVGAASGSVREIGLFATELKQADGVYVLIPNSQVWGTVIRNFSRNSTRRIEVALVVPHGTDIAVGIDVLAQVAANRERVVSDPPPSAFAGPISDVGVTLILWAWTPSDGFADEQVAVRTECHAALRAAGISVARPVREVVLTNGTLPAA